MITQPSLGISVVSSSSATTAQGQASIPGFIRIPRELRDRIYSCSVTVDQHFDYKGFGRHNGFKPQDMAITCNTSSTQPGKTCIFAYHPLTYGHFITDLIDYMKHAYETVQVFPSASLSGSTFKKLAEPLDMLRDMSDVNPHDSNGSGIVMTLSFIYDFPGFSPGELIQIKRCFQHQGQNAELNSRFSNAMCHYWLEELFHSDNGHDKGTEGSNSLIYIGAESAIGFSRSVHKHIVKLSKSTPYTDIIRLDRPSIITKSIQAIKRAFRYPGLTDSQRRAAHLYRSLALFHHGQLMDHLSHVEWSTTYEPHGQRIFYHDILGLDCRGYYIGGHIFYYLAAKDLFYAQQVDPLYDLLQSLDADDRVICRKIQQRPGPQAFPVAEYAVPLLGTWRGDPRLWRDLSGSDSLLIKLFRQRCNELADGDTVDNEELKRQDTALGITWQHSDWGSLLLDP
ncbi:hypothetical protein PG996_015944 [Apiospora saccharicola]|uniref:Uncharacterized protein n=1 Tax=Apiospora saccharicola TaxID=335842 RepID=A0ABR1TMK4_9PEZI